MRCMELPGRPVSGQGRRYRGTPAGMPRAHWLLLGCAYLVDFGAAGGAHSAGCGLAILHGHLLWVLDLSLRLALHAVSGNAHCLSIVNLWLPADLAPSAVF